MTGVWEFAFSLNDLRSNLGDGEQRRLARHVPKCENQYRRDLLQCLCALGVLWQDGVGAVLPARMGHCGCRGHERDSRSAGSGHSTGH